LAVPGGCGMATVGEEGEEVGGTAVTAAQAQGCGGAQSSDRRCGRLAAFDEHRRLLPE
jgi:hypothetical protein